jgi:hypothetical protein
MKPQDIIFIIIIIILIWKKSPKLSIATGLISLFLAIPLFHFWIFFTAERLTWYATIFFLLAIITIYIKKN